MTITTSISTKENALSPFLELLGTRRFMKRNERNCGIYSNADTSNINASTLYILYASLGKSFIVTVSSH